MDRHAADLHAANRTATDPRDWTYLAYGPFDSLESYQSWMQRVCLGDDPLFHAIVDNMNGKAIGVASYLRIEPGERLDPRLGISTTRRCSSANPPPPRQCT